MATRNIGLSEAGKYFDSEGKLQVIGGTNISVSFNHPAGEITINNTGIDSSRVENIIDNDYVKNIADSDYIKTVATTEYIRQQADSTYIKGIADSSYISAFVDNDFITSALNDSLNIDFLYVNGQIGIGTNTFNSTGGVKLNIVSDGASTGNDIIVTHYSNSASDPSDIVLRKARGSEDTPTTVQASDLVASMAIYQRNSSDQWIQSGAVKFSATDSENSYFNLQTRVDGNLANRIDVISDGRVRLNGYLTFPLTSGSVGQVLETDADGNLSWTTVTAAAGGIDSAAVQELIDSTYVKGFIDSAYINARVDAGVDSAKVEAIVDSAYINARVDAGVDSAKVEAIVDSAYIQARQITYDFLDSVEVIALIDSNYVQARQITYSTADFLDSAHALSLFSGGTGVTYDGSGQFSIGQSVGTSDDVTFADITVDNLTVNGTTTTVNSVTYTIVDPLLHLADSNETSDTVDIGFVGHYSDDGGSTKRHTGFFRDASNSQYYIFNGLIDSGLDSSLPINTVNRGGTGFELATLNVGSLVGNYAGFDSDFGVKATTTNISTFINDAKYLDSTTVQGVIDPAYIQANQTTYTNVSEFVNDANYLDSTTVQNVINAAYIQSNQTTYDFLDSAEVIALIDSAYINARVEVDAGTDSATVVIIINDTVDSDYVQLRQDYAYSSLTGAPTNVSSFVNDANYLDSTTVTGVIDSDYIQSRQITYDFLDSAEVIALIDSAYVQQRQDYAYSSLTGKPNILDSNHIVSIIDSTYINSLTDANIDSAALIAVVDSAYVQQRQDFAYASLTGAPNVLDSARVEAIVEDYGYTTYDSTNAAGQIEAYGYTTYDSTNAAGQITSYGYTTYDSTNAAGQIEAYGYTTYDSNNFTQQITAGSYATQSYVTSQINNLVDGAPGALDTLSELAAALNNDSQAYNTLLSQINALPDSSQVATIIESYGYTTLDSANVESIIDSAYINARVDVGIDSAAVIALIDSNYIAARAPGTVGLSQYTYVATADQTTFTDSDHFGNVLNYAAGYVQVHRNGVLLVDSAQYTATSGTSIILSDAADSDDIIAISSYTNTRGLFNVTDTGSGISITGNLTATGTLTVAKLVENVDSSVGATGTVNYDFNTASVFYSTNPSADWTPNFTNVPTDNEKVISLSLVINQGSTAYVPTALQVNSSAVTPLFAGGIDPVGEANGVNVISYSLLRTNGSWIVLASDQAFS
jgi:hypothetical protein